MPSARSARAAWSYPTMIRSASRPSSPMVRSEASLLPSLPHSYLRQGLRSVQSQIRTVAAMAIASIAHWDWPQKWPGLLHSLIECLGSNDNNLVLLILFFLLLLLLLLILHLLLLLLLLLVCFVIIDSYLTFLFFPGGRCHHLPRNVCDRREFV